MPWHDKYGEKILNKSYSPTIGLFVSPSGHYESITKDWKDSYTKRVRPKGLELLFNGQSLLRERVLYLENKVRLNRPDGTWVENPSGNFLSWPTPTEGDAPNSNAMASRLHSKVKNQKVNLALALAEYRQTANLFADTAQRVAAAYRRLRRGDPIGMFIALGGSNRRKVSSNWLAFQYGVRPAVSDVVQSLKLLDAKRLSTKVFKAVVNNTSTTSKTDSYGTTNIRGTASRVTRTININRKDRLTCYYTVDSGVIKTASSLGLTNPLSLAWELVPHSFVVDWFINVGDYLASIDTLVGVSRSVVYRGRSIIYDARLSAVDCGSISYTSRRTIREGPSPFPALQLQFAPSLSWQRITSAVALLRQSRSI